MIGKQVIEGMKGRRCEAAMEKERAGGMKRIDVKDSPDLYVYSAALGKVVERSFLNPKKLGPSGKSLACRLFLIAPTDQPQEAGAAKVKA